MRKVWFLSILALVIAGLQAPAFAGLVLTNGITAGPVTGGNLSFSNFFCSVVDVGNPANLSPTDCNQISVVSSLLGGNGISFIGPFFVQVPTGGTVDMTLTYDVTASASMIDDIFMNFDGSVIGTGTYFATITEQAFSGLTMVGSVVVSAPIGSRTGDVSLTAGPYETLHILKDIQFTGSGTEGQAGAIVFSHVDQVFSEVVPEPGTITLLGTALLGCAAIFRRQLKKRG